MKFVPGLLARPGRPLRGLGGLGGLVSSFASASGQSTAGHTWPTRTTSMPSGES